MVGTKTSVLLPVLLGASLARCYTPTGPWRPCPDACEDVGVEPSGWPQYHTLRHLDSCNETILFDLSIYNPVDVPAAQFNVRACSSDSPFALSRDASEQPYESLVKTRATLAAWGSTGNASVDNVVSAAQKLKFFIQEHHHALESTIMLAKAGQAVTGVYVGSQIHGQSAAAIIQEYINASRDSGTAFQRSVGQVCPDTDPFNSQIFGIFTDTNNDVAAVQSALRSWNEAECVTEGGPASETSSISTEIKIMSAIEGGDGDSAAVKRNLYRQHRSHHLHGSHDSHGLIKRATCRYVRAGAGDGCWALAEKCGITQAKLESFNAAGTCQKTIFVGQPVCCEAGTLPDFSPKPPANGICFVYTIKPNDLCDTIATTHYMTVARIQELNKNTWGWAGCNKLQLGQRICLSTGKRCFPAPVEGNVCGPQVVGTARPAADDAIWANLNPCPLNACCNTWGQCGITPDFCTRSAADTGNPGTAKPGENGCISNCGTEITNNAKFPPHVWYIAYFESWNLDRPCLNMDISKLNNYKPYNTVHFAFGDITPEFQVDVSEVQEQFDGFVKLESMHRVLSFGGWSFSTERDTFPIFRQGVTVANRDTFVNSVVGFALEHDLDGLDFDWEYPGAPDIVDPPGHPDDGKRYLEFLRLVRARLPAGKTVSIAAPASYWYLKGFPIKDIAEVCNYIVYMTYDLHGQWDYGNKFSNPGCENGNCLRSHVNSTEIQYALSMITKAGVPASKVVPGYAMYGRSFRMAQVGCTGPECTFSQQGADPGPCTKTSGYLSKYEIDQIIAEAEDPESDEIISIQKYTDAGSNILVYNNNQWLAYPHDLSTVAIDYLSKHFAGVVTWAVDLEDSYGDGGKGSSASELLADLGDLAPCDLDLTFNSLEELHAHVDEHKPSCLPYYAMETLAIMYETAYANYTDVNNSYDEKFDAYVRYIKAMAPAAIAQFMFQSSNSMSGNGIQYFDCSMVLHSEGPEPVKKRCDAFSKEQLEEGTFDMDITLRDKEGFDKALMNKTGLDPTWISFTGTHDTSWLCFEEVVQMCPPETGYREWHKWPKLKGDVVIPDPKDVITDGMKTVDSVVNELNGAWAELVFGNFIGAGDDYVQVMSIPVFMLLQAVESMAQVKVIGEEQEEIEEEQRRNVILTIISAIFCVVPFIGELSLLASGATNLARAAMIAGEVANGALAMYDLIENPDSALLNLMGMLLGVGGMTAVKRDGINVNQMASLRRELTDGQKLTGLGAVFKRNDDALQGIFSKKCS